MPRHDIQGRHERLAQAIGLLDSASGRDDATTILRDHARAIADADGITVVLREGEQVFGVAHIYASFNDTFVHVTDMRCV